MTGRQLFDEYKTYPGTWDEMCFDQNIRPQYQQVFNDISQLPDETLQQKDKLAGELFMNQGITFTVYSDDAGIERVFPFDIIPRILTASEWEHIQRRHYATASGIESFSERYLLSTANNKR